MAQAASMIRGLIQQARHYPNSDFAREALTLLRKGQREVPVDDVLVFERASADTEDAELRFLKDTHRQDFRRVFKKAVAELDAKDRALIRYHYLDGLTLERVGKIVPASR